MTAETSPINLLENSQPLLDEVFPADHKRKRASSMDILAEAASTSLSGQTSHASDDSSTDAKENLKHLVSFSIQNQSLNQEKAEDDSIQTFQPFFRQQRPRGATFSYSPFKSEDPEFENIIPDKSGMRALSWLAKIVDDEVSTAEVLSGLSNFKV
jgi:hypothetical protein